MFIEDLIILLATRAKMNPFDTKLVDSFQDQIYLGRGFTEKQAQLAVKICLRHIEKANQILGRDIRSSVENPVFKLARRTITSDKRISVVSHNMFVKALKAEFPYNEEIVNKIRQQRSKLNFAQWDKEEKSWFFSLDEKSIEFLSEFIEKFNFAVDDELHDYLVQTKIIKDNFEKYIPIVRVENNSIFFDNVPACVPQPKNNDVLESLFLARTAGIQVWDEKIDQRLTALDVTDAVKKFLDSQPGQIFEHVLENSSIYDIKEIIKHLTPSLFVIPGGTELEKLEMALDLLKVCGFDHQEISVLFRLPNETGENFNKFVKNSQLNNPVSENTKIVFISSKVPKTILEPEIKFNSVVNFSFYSVHHTIRDFVKNHHNVIQITEKKQQRSFNFALL